MKNFFVTTQNFSSWCHLDHHVDVDVGVMTHLGSTCRWPGWHPGGVRTTRWSSGDHQVDIPDTNPVSNPGCPDPGCRIPGSRSGIPESRIGIPDPGIRDPDPRSEVGPGYPPNPQFDHLVGGVKLGVGGGVKSPFLPKNANLAKFAFFRKNAIFPGRGPGKLSIWGWGTWGGQICKILPNFANLPTLAKFAFSDRQKTRILGVKVLRALCKIRERKVREAPILQSKSVKLCNLISLWLREQNEYSEGKFCPWRAKFGQMGKSWQIWQIWQNLANLTPRRTLPQELHFWAWGTRKNRIFPENGKFGQICHFLAKWRFYPPSCIPGHPPYRMVKLGFWGVPVRNPDSGIRNPGSGSGIRIRESGIRDPDGRGIGHGTKSWVATFGDRHREPKLNFGFPDSVSQLHGATRVRRSGHRGCVRVTSLAMYHAKKIRVTQLAEKIFRI